MSKKLRFALPILAILLIGVFAFTRSEGSSPKVGHRFPKLEPFALEGKLPDLAGKVVLVDFWASWCGPCQKAFPSLQKLHQTFESRGFLVLGISLDEKKTAMEDFLKKSGTTFPIVRDDGGKLSDSLGLDTVPTSFLLGIDGKILAIHEGFEGPEAVQKVSDEIEAALKAAKP